MKKHIIVPLLTLAFIFSGCDEKKQLTEMHDATVDMNGKMDKLLNATTTKMDQLLQTTSGKMDMLQKTTGSKMDMLHETTRKKMEEMAALTTEVLKRSDELSDLSKHGATTEGRNNRLKEILTDVTAENKVVHAAIYFKSFEYQFWEGIGPDISLEKRQVLIDEAASEFFRAIAEFNNNSSKVDPFAIAGSPVLWDYGNREVVFNALALTMHMLDRKQVEMLQKFPEVKPVTMLSIIEEALQAEININSGKLRIEEVSEATQMVLSNKPIALKLLQARHNFALVCFINSASKLATAQDSRFGQITTALGLGFISKGYELGKMGGAGLLGKILGGEWLLNIDKFNLVQIVDFQKSLEIAKSTRMLLKKMNQGVQINENLSKVMNNMKIQTTGTGDVRSVVEKTKLVGLLKDLK